MSAERIGALARTSIHVDERLHAFYGLCNVVARSAFGRRPGVVRHLKPYCAVTVGT